MSGGLFAIFLFVGIFGFLSLQLMWFQKKWKAGMKEARKCVHCHVPVAPVATVCWSCGRGQPQDDIKTEN